MSSTSDAEGHDARHLVRNGSGFELGYSPITRAGEVEGDTGIDFGILRLSCGSSHRIAAGLERALLLMHGAVALTFDNQQAEVERSSLFDEDPVALHCCAATEVRIEARSDCELALIQTENPTPFATRLFDGRSMLESEHRGKGRLGDAAYRIVRTIFDLRNRPEARLVLGEVITFPGRWSSYPPHHHVQPEIYHYRFTEPQGYGHAELGHRVLRVQQFDTVKILDRCDHPQVAAPGYGMYYLWTIRHLPEAPYRGFEFCAEHDWLNQPAPRIWHPATKESSR